MFGENKRISLFGEEEIRSDLGPARTEGRDCDMKKQSFLVSMVREIYITGHNNWMIRNKKKCNGEDTDWV
jgi:hypothetical protein